MDPGFRRRILIEPTPGVATAQLEDDYHRMVVRLSHAGGVIVEVSSRMQRSPWTTCEGAMARLAETFTGATLAEVAKRGEKTTNCTHLYDLALFASAHADETASVAYDIFVSDPVDGRREALLVRNGALRLHWRFHDGRLVAPEELADRSLAELGDWIAAQDREAAEAGRILRWASMLALGRAIDMPAGMSATAFPPGTCYTFQPAQAGIGRRKPGADVDFSRGGIDPLHDRPDRFPRGAAQAF